MKISRALLLVWVLILAYGCYFSVYSIQRHRALMTHASDLGQIDQAIWNTLQGHLLEDTKPSGVQSTRLTDHVEPIFIPLSLAFVIYDNVEALLIVQSFAIAIGALAIFWIARRRVGEWAAVGFAGMYLLFPSLEAANLAEFHAVALAPAPLLFAYHYGTEGAWGRFAFLSILALAVKEEISLLVFVMAAWFAVEPLAVNFRRIGPDLQHLLRHPLSAFRNRVPLVIAVLAAAWFVLTVGIIIPRFSPVGHSIYTCRYVAGEDCRDVARGLFLGPRLTYMAQLLASSGWIALLDPLSLVLGLPLLAANVLSNFPAQYSGTFHYSAPIAPYLVLAAIGGSARAIEWLSSRRAGRKDSAPLGSRPARLAVLVPGFLLALGFHFYAGYLPFGGAFDFPQVTPHDQLLARFTSQVADPDLVVSTTSSLNPHLSHRRVLYRYPIVNDARYVLLDVGESATSNPTDFAVAYHGLVDNGTFGVVDAADGFVLMERGAPPRPLPDAFFTLFLANGRQPRFKTVVDFSDAVRFLGYDVENDSSGRGSLRTYWQRLKPLDKNYNLFPFYADDQGNPRPEVTLSSPVLFWYPTSMWQAEQVVVAQTVPFDLGPRTRVGLAVIDGNDFGDVKARLHAHPVSPSTQPVFDDSTWVELTTLVKDGNHYVAQ